MPTSAEANRQAQEDAMMRQIAMQAAAQRQRQQEMAGLKADRAASQDAAVRAAQVQADAQIRAAEILAQREAANNAAIGDRQLALAREGRQMTDAQKAALALQERQFRSTPAGMVESLLGDESAPAPTGSVAAVDAPAAPVAKPSPGVPYDMTGFRSDVEGIAENVKVARNQSPGQLSYDDLPAYQPGMQGAFVRDPTGTLRQVHFPEASSSKTPNRAAIEALKAQMMPQAPTPGVTGGGASAATHAVAPAAPVAPAADQKVEAKLKLMRALGMIPEDPEAVRTREKQAKAEASVAQQAASILDELGAKPKLTPKESAQWRDVASQYAKATGSSVLRQAPTESDPVEFVKSQLEDFSKQAEDLAGGSFGYASEDDVMALRLKAQEIKTAMRQAGYAEPAIQKVVNLLDDAMKRTEGGLIIKQGITEPKRIGILSDY